MESMKSHAWKFENGSIKQKQLKEITEDFTKVLPYLQERNRITGFDLYFLWSAFRGGKHSQEFIFGVHNTSNQEVEATGKHNEAIQVFLTVAKKHLGHGIHIESDLNDLEWRKGISLCQNILGHEYDLMDITANGKLRFKEWELATHGR